MPTDPSRGLLFAIFAIHLDFITRDQLTAAIAEWIRQPSRPIAEILVERKALDPRTRDVVADVVARYLEQHGGDAERSIASLGDKGLIPPELAPALGGSMTSDAATSASAGVAGDDTSDPISLAGYAAGGTRYRVLRPQDRGGMGEVFVARDLELGREVLLKQLPERRADDPQFRAAFLKEVRAGAALEHPNIAPVYDVGQYPGGRLFQVMRLIPGGTLQRAIRDHHDSRGSLPEAERVLRFRELLGHFVDACQAIEYAHSRGVLHRDIKPSNIMLGSFGETQVIDWGLARIVGHDLSDGKGSPAELISPEIVGEGSQPTEYGQFKGTPAYASPEQAHGKLDLVDSRSDVYGLGATFYCLLTGAAPFHSQSPFLMDDVRKGRFPRPRQVRSDVPPALESICLKAMAHAQENRYQSPRDLATDVERWLADEPVLAHPDPFSVRLRRWGLRHRTAVAAATALLLTSVVGLGIGYAAVKKQRDVAEKSTDLTLEAIEKIVIEIGDDTWAQDPASEPRRRQAMNVAIAMYNDVLKTDRGNRRAKIGLTEANRRMGNLFGWSGDQAQSVGFLQQSVDSAESHLEDDPETPETYGPVIDGRSDMAVVRLYMDGPDVAEVLQRETCRRAVEAGRRFPQSSLIRELQARADYALAEILTAKGSTDEAFTHMEASAKAYSELADGVDGTETQTIRAFSAWSDVSQLCRDLGLVDKSREAVREVVSWKAKLELIPNNHLISRIAVAQSLRERAMSQGGGEVGGDTSEAMLGDALQVFSELVKDKPDVWRFKRDKILVQIERGSLRLAANDIEGATLDADDALKAIPDMHAPPGAKTQLMARAYALRGLVADRRGEPKTAVEMFGSAAEQCQEARKLGFGAISRLEAEITQHLESSGAPRDP
jgi:serine/threonine-protein kinase